MGTNTIIGMIPIERIRAAAERARPHVLRTPLLPVEGAQLKAECLQPTGSFKVRGFFAAALALPPEQLKRGLITVSAGNAAQACAYVAHELGVSCRVVMFDTAPTIKVDGVKRWGATPIPMPREDLFKWIETEGWKKEPEAFLHPFNNDELMAGHGGLGLELIEDVPDLERVLVPVGGGGLVTGVASALKGSRHGIEVIGVQSDGYAMWAKVVAEGAGALAYAALEQLPPGPPTVAVVSGGTIDPVLLATLLSN